MVDGILKNIKNDLRLLLLTSASIIAFLISTITIDYSLVKKELNSISTSNFTKICQDVLNHRLKQSELIKRNDSLLLNVFNNCTINDISYTLNNSLSEIIRNDSNYTVLDYKNAFNQILNSAQFDFPDFDFENHLNSLKNKKSLQLDSFKTIHVIFKQLSKKNSNNKFKLTVLGNNSFPIIDTILYKSVTDFMWRPKSDDLSVKSIRLTEPLYNTLSYTIETKREGTGINSKTTELYSKVRFFKELDRVNDNFLRLSLGDATKYCENKISDTPKEISLAGIKLSRDIGAVFGAIFILGLLISFLIHLNHLKIAITNNYIPEKEFWFGLYITNNIEMAFLYSLSFISPMLAVAIIFNYSLIQNNAFTFTVSCANMAICFAIFFYLIDYRKFITERIKLNETQN